MIVISHQAAPAQRWLAHLTRAAEGTIRAGDPFDDLDPFEDGAVLRLAQRARLTPLLHRACAENRIADSLTAGFRQACERIYYTELRKNIVAQNVAAPLLPALARVGIPAAPLAGWAFTTGSAPLYPDPGTRPMDDLDLIVKPDQREKAMSVLAGHGFRQVTGGVKVAVAGHEVAFHRREAGVDVFVELRWAWAGSESLHRDFAVTGDRFLNELCEPAEDGSRRPTPLGHILFTSLHAARHTFDRWVWLVDLHRLLEREAAPWSALLEAAERWRVRRPLYAALTATRELLRTPIPKEMLAALAPGPVRRRLLHRTLSQSAEDPRRPRSAWAAKVLLGESWWDVARTAAWTAAPGEARYAARGRTPMRRGPAAHPVRSIPPSGGDS